MSMTFNFRQLDRKWQQVWEQHSTFRAANPGEPESDKPPFYVLDFFPYPSGAGLHVGHPLGYIASDIIARYMRMKGFNVLHPMGWDAFGLPAEQYAIETGVHPAVTTRRNIETYTQQLKMIGLSFDWSREIATCDPDYYHWTQWVFLQLFDSWYDPDCHWIDDAGRTVVGRARPMADLPIPSEIQAQGAAAIESFRSGHRLAFLSEVPVNWCPALGTVLANEEVTADGRSERGDHPVFKRPLKQWMLRITRYAERLLGDLEPLDWPEPIKLMQRNWIGRSEGAFVNFALADLAGESLRVYTTRPDTLFGATYMVLAPEHPLVARISTAAQRPSVDEYVAAAARKSEVDRTAEGKVKTGVFTGAQAINPVNGQPIPIWIADYVLAGYGTGAIMAVPGSDSRDHEFAEKFNLPIVQVVQPPDGVDWLGFEDDGIAVNSPPSDLRRDDFCNLNGLPTPHAKRAIIGWLEARGLGNGTVQYKLRDWLFSRQRYWGEPFPLLHRADGTIVAVDASQLPVTLPEVADFKPTASNDPNAVPQTPLSRATDWMRVSVNGSILTREANTMPQWAGSCWYYLRFCDAKNSRAAISPTAEKYWASSGAKPHGKAVLPSITAAPKSPEKIGFVDLYVGGAEHAVLHLLYARFWHKVLYDRGVVSTPEPFQRLFNQGMITSVAYRDSRDVYIERSDVEIQNHNPLDALHRVTREKLSARVEKMSKSKKNVVNPDEICEQYGADTLRLYEMFLGPIDAGKPWSTEGINGVHRFLQRAWRLVAVEEDDVEAMNSATGLSSSLESRTPKARLNPRIGNQRDEALERLLHKAIAKVTLDIDRFAFNTAISEMMVWSTEAAKAEHLHRDQVERFVLLLAPFAPHLAEELWQQLGHPASLAREPWPTFDPALTRDDTIELAVQVNGKLRARIQVAADANDATIIAAAKAVDAIQKELAGRPTKREIVVKGRLVNLIV